MATIISEQEAFAHLAEVMSRALHGEEIDIEQAGTIKLKLLPIQADKPRRGSFGFLRGKISVPPSTFEPLPEEELRAWEGR